MTPRRLIFRDHATRRIMQRRIRASHIRRVLEYGEMIESYPNDTPYPSRLILGWIDGKPLHIVVADDPSLEVTFIITVYEPDPNLWETDFKQRKPE